MRRGKLAYEITSDDKTVWVNAADGACVGRFSHFGVDVHNTATAMLNGAPQCLECAHGLPPRESWERFKQAMRRHHEVDVIDSFMPRFVKEATYATHRNVGPEMPGPCPA